jgi:DNA-binding NtrC family response regulator
VTPSILIVDDQASITHFLTRALLDEGYAARAVGTVAEALAAIAEEVPDVAILDLRLPDGNGLQLLQRVKAIEEEVAVILMTAHGEVESAVRAMKCGAADYLQKPVNLEQLKLVLAKELERRSLWRELRHHRAEQTRRFTGELIRGRSLRMEEVFAVAEKVALAELTSVLIEGESGTGKQVVASYIHALSPRSGHPFVELNCAAIPGELLESELFGHEKGAFTDAKELKPGLLETADGGTLFLDEVGEMPLSLQVKLLKVLEGMTFRRVGGTRDIRVSVRILSATNRDLAARCGEGAFREDLYYRLKVVPITVPPLRERGDDVLIFAKHFLLTYSKQFGKRFRGLTPAAEKRLLGHRWPGNIRELRNLFEQTVLLEDGDILDAHQLRLPRDAATVPHDALAQITTVLAEGRIGEAGIDLEGLLGETEVRLIRLACEQVDWNQSATARLLQLGRDKLRYRMKLHGLRREDEDAA